MNETIDEGNPREMKILHYAVFTSCESSDMIRKFAEFAYNFNYLFAVESKHNFKGSRNNWTCVN